MLKFRRPEPIPLIFILCATALSVSLGVWQLERLKWKSALIAEIAAAQKEPPAASLQGGEKLAWRGALLSGRFVPDKAFRFIGRASSGYVWAAPFQLKDGKQAVLAVVGWAPTGEKPAIDARMQSIGGTLRPPRPPRLFSPPNQPEKNLWFTEDLRAMEQVADLRFAPLVLDTGGLPRPRNDHLGYAITWFLLAGIGLGMFALYYREKP